MMAINYKKIKYSKILIAVLIAFLFFLLLNFLSQGAKNLFYSISSPFQKFFWQIGQKSSDFFIPFLMVNKIKIENSKLVIKNQELLTKLSLLEELKSENQTLREVLNAGLQKDFKFIVAEVISKDALKDSILIDKGSEDGVLKDMPIINQQKVLFGKVSEVYKNFSRIALISDKNFVSDIKIQSKEIYGVIRGIGNLSLYLDLIPRDADLKDGDILLTSSFGGGYPKDLLLGRVSRVIKEDTKSFQEAKAEPIFDLKSTDTLLVITNFKN